MFPPLREDFTRKSEEARRLSENSQEQGLLPSQGSGEAAPRPCEPETASFPERAGLRPTVCGGEPLHAQGEVHDHS